MTADTILQNVLVRACAQAGLDTTDVTLMRIGENAIYRLPKGVIARITRPGQRAAAHREVQVSRWLETSSIPAVRAIADIEQPVVVDDRAVTFWHELPTHHPGAPVQVAYAPAPTPQPPTPGLFRPLRPGPLRPAGPANRIRTIPHRTRPRLDANTSHRTTPTMEPSTHRFALVCDTRRRLDRQRRGHRGRRHRVPRFGTNLVRPSGMGHCPHRDQTHVLWLDHCRGLPKVLRCVRAWEGFNLLRDIREFRMTTMAVQTATTNPVDHEQALHRLACIQGRHGPRPWINWHSLS